MITFDEAKTQSKNLQNNASEVIKILNIETPLSKLGDPEFVGSYSYNLMSKPDVDIEVYTEDLNFNKVVDFSAGYAKRPDMVIVTLRNYTQYSPSQSMPRSIYCGFQYQYNGILWNFDIWFLSRKDKLSIQGLDKNWNEEITDEQRGLIVLLKSLIIGENKKYKSVDIYQAVILGGVKNISELEEYIENRR